MRQIHSFARCSCSRSRRCAAKQRWRRHGTDGSGSGQNAAWNQSGGRREGNVPRVRRAWCAHARLCMRHTHTHTRTRMHTHTHTHTDRERERESFFCLHPEAPTLAVAQSASKSAQRTLPQPAAVTSAALSSFRFVEVTAPPISWHFSKSPSAVLVRLTLCSFTLLIRASSSASSASQRIRHAAVVKSLAPPIVQAVIFLLLVLGVHTFNRCRPSYVPLWTRQQECPSVCSVERCVASRIRPCRRRSAPRHSLHVSRQTLSAVAVLTTRNR